MNLVFVIAFAFLGILGGILGNPHLTQADPAMVFDAKSSKIIYSEDEDRLWHPASLTKLRGSWLPNYHFLPLNKTNTRYPASSQTTAASNSIIRID